MTNEQVGMLIRNADGSVAWAPWESLPAEAVCPKCDAPIRWALDMFSFTTGFDETHPFTLTHARCAWTAEAFDFQRALGAYYLEKRAGRRAVSGTPEKPE